MVPKCALQIHSRVIYLPSLFPVRRRSITIRTKIAVSCCESLLRYKQASIMFLFCFFVCLLNLFLFCKIKLIFSLLWKITFFLYKQSKIRTRYPLCLVVPFSRFSFTPPLSTVLSAHSTVPTGCSSLHSRNTGVHWILISPMHNACFNMRSALGSR